MDKTKADENLKRWMGMSKVVNDDGSPKVMYHGTFADFDKFKKRVGDIGIHFGDAATASDRVAEFVPHRRNKDGTETSACVMPVYLSIQNPLRMRDHGFWNADNMKGELLKLFPGDAAIIGPEWGSRGLSTTRDIREYLQSKGFDGVVYTNTGEVQGAEPFRERMRFAEQAMRAVFPKGKQSFDLEDQNVPEFIAYMKAQQDYRQHRESSGTDSYIVFEATQIKSALGNSGAYSITNNDISDRKSLSKDHKAWLASVSAPAPQSDTSEDSARQQRKARSQAALDWLEAMKPKKTFAPGN